MLKKILKIINAKQGFNLLRYSSIKKAVYEDAPYVEDQQDAGDSIGVMNPPVINKQLVQRMGAYIDKNIGKDVPDPIPPEFYAQWKTFMMVVNVSIPYPQLAEQFITHIQKPRMDLEAKMREYISNNMGEVNITPVPPEFFSHWVEFMEVVEEMIPYPKLAEEFITHIQKSRIDEADGIDNSTKETSIVDQSNNYEDLFTLFLEMPNTLDLLNKIARYRQADSGSVIDAAKKALGGPEQNNNIDYRIAFFAANKDKIPEDISFEIKDLLSTVPGDMRYIKKEHIQIFNYILENFGDTLVNKLKALILSSDPSIEKWISTKVQGEKTPTSYSQNVGSGEGDGVEMSDLINSEKGKEVAGLRTEGKEGKKRVFDISKTMTQIFCKQYIPLVLKDVHDMADKVYEGLIKKSDVKDPKMTPEESARKSARMVDNANRLIVYINSAIQQTSEVFGKNSDYFEASQRHVLKSNEDSSGSRKTLGEMRIPPIEEMQKLLEYVGKAIGEKIDEVDPNDPRLEDVIQQYIKTSKISWLPDWTKWVTGIALNEKLKEAGRFQNLYKKYEQNPLKSGLTPDDLSYIQTYPKKLFNGNEAMANLFKDSIKTQSYENINKWLNAGNKALNGISDPKQQFTSNVTTYMKDMYDLSQDEKNPYGPSVMRTFFNLVAPHGDFINGGPHAAGRVKDMKDENGNPINFSDLYYKLTQKDKFNAGIEDDFAKKDVELSRYVADVKSRIKRVNLNKELSPEQKELKKEKIFELYNKYDRYSKAIKDYGSYIRKKKEIITLKKNIEWEKNQKPKLKTKGQIATDERIKQKLQEIQNNEQFIKDYQTSKNNILHANTKLLSIIYASFITSQNQISKLNNMKNRFSNIKVASTDFVDDMIDKVKMDFVENFGHLLD